MDPRPRGAVGRLKGPDFLVALQRQHHFVEPLQQACAPTRIDFEAVLLSRWRDNHLRLEVDADASRPLRDLDFCGQTIDNLLVDDNRQNSVLETVGKEDVAKA